MSIFDRLSERVEDFIEEVMLPEEIHSLHQRAREAIDRGDYQSALQLLGEAEHRRPNTERTRRLRALCHFYLDHLDRAAELFEEALQLREEASSHFYLGLCFEKQGRISDAHAHFQRAFTVDEDPPFAYDLHFALGRTYLALDRPDKATRELRKAHRIWPDQIDAASYLAEALRRRDRAREAAQILRPLIDDIYDRQALLTLGRVEVSLREYESAARAFETVLEHNPDDRDALLGGARTHLDLHQPGRANELLLRALSGDDSDDADIFALIGETNERVDNLDKARQSYEAALNRDPDHSAARIGAARMALRLRDYELAARHFEKSLRAASRDHRGEALLGLGQCRLAQGDPAGARRLLEEADQFYRHRPARLLHALGGVALHSDDPAEALVVLRRALHADPDAELRKSIESDIDRALTALQPSWTPPASYDSTAELVSAISELQEEMRTEPRLESFLPRIHSLLTDLDSPLAVAILGEFNAGKSTLVNALLGEEVVPMGILPTTAHPCIMTYGPRKGARIHYEDGHLEDADFATARKRMKESSQDIVRFDYTYPHPELRSLNYWDTPGFNALDERHEALADEALAKAEAIIWLLDANQALKETEFERLRAIPDSSLRVILVVNKTDRFGDKEDRREKIDEIVDYLETHAGEHVLDILAISALEALEARSSSEDPDHATLPKDFEKLLHLLDREFVQRSWRIKITEVSRALNSLLDDIHDLRESELNRYRELAREAKKLRKVVDEPEDERRARAKEHALSLADRFDFVTVGVEREIDGALRRRGRIFRRTVLDPDDRRFVLELLRERLAHVLENTRRDVLDEVTNLESTLAERLSPLLAALSVPEARPLRRRLEGFFDESRALKRLLDERVFGQWKARSDGQIDSGGDAILDAIVELGEDADSDQRRTLLTELIPSTGEDFSTALAHWYEEFFLAASRFCDRLFRDLSTLELEVHHRLNYPTTAACDN